MKQIILALLMIVTVAVVNTYASNDNDSTKTEAKVKFKAPEEVTAVSIVTQRPPCGSSSPQGWEDDYTHCNNGGCVMVQKRTCLETVHIPFAPPPGFITFERTEQRVIAIE